MGIRIPGNPANSFGVDVKLSISGYAWVAIWSATSLWVAMLYFVGLPGDFLFDDNPHIVRNQLVQIGSLSPADLWQAWSSSHLDFPGSRPLAMLTFGINHAVSGLSPFAFKATNLALHILNGLALFAVARRVGQLFLRVAAVRDGVDAAALSRS